MLTKTGFEFCPKCGRQTLTGSPKFITCRSCNYIYYHNCGGAVAALITSGSKLLVVMRKYEPGKGLYGLPGGFVDYGETLEQSLLREIDEELSITLKAYHYYCSFPNTYFYRDVLYHTIDCYFRAEIDKDAKIIPRDDAEAYKWIELNAIDEHAFAFESAKQAVRQYIAEMIVSSGCR